MAFSADPDTGIYNVTSNVLGITVAGSASAQFSATYSYSVPPFLSEGGSATAPAYSFNGDANTGIYRVGADQLGISTGGTLRVDVSTTAVTSTLPIFIPTGSAGAPGLAFSGDTDTGIWDNGANGLTFVSGGVSELQVGSGEIAVTTLLSSPKIKVTASVPASAGATGATGEIRVGTGFIYICTATNTWQRVATATW